jgi:hypothetical protein
LEPIEEDSQQLENSQYFTAKGRFRPAKEAESALNAIQK